MQEPIDSTDSLEVFQVLGVDQGGEDERFLEERRGVGRIVGGVDMRRSPSLGGVLLFGQVLGIVIVFELVLLLLTEETLELGHGRSLVDLGDGLVTEDGVYVSRLLIITLLGRTRAEVIRAYGESAALRDGVVRGGLFVGGTEVDGVEDVILRVPRNDSGTGVVNGSGPDQVLSAPVRLLQVDRGVCRVGSHGGGDQLSSVVVI